MAAVEGRSRSPAHRLSERATPYPPRRPLMRTKDIPAGILPEHRALYYDGAWHEPRSGHYADTINPAYNEPIMQAPVADAADVDAAVCAANAAFEGWSRVSPSQRGMML